MAKTFSIIARMIALALALLLALVFTGCTVCTANRVFPKLTWAWTRDAKLQRESDAREKAYAESLKKHE